MNREEARDVWGRVALTDDQVRALFPKAWRTDRPRWRRRLSVFLHELARRVA